MGHLAKSKAAGRSARFTVARTTLALLPHLFRIFGPVDNSFFAAAFVGQQDSAHGAQRLLRGYIQRGFLLNRIANIGVVGAIVSALGLYFARLAAHGAESSPAILRFHSPVGAPVGAVGAGRAAQDFLLRVHTVLHERTAGAVQKHVVFGGVGDDAGVQGGAQPRILHVDVERVVDL